jgi:hypothetical protein
MMTKIALLTLISIGALWVNPATLTAQDATQDAPTIDPNAQQALAVRVHYAGVTLQLDGRTECACATRWGTNPHGTRRYRTNR